MANSASPSKERYSRQIILPEIGDTGQNKLLAAKAIIVGAGGLGCPSALYLAASGVGHLTIVDDDHVAASNLNRQIAFEEADTGRRKTDALADRLSDFNSDVSINKITDRLTTENAEKIISGHDILVDCTDSFAARDAINSACVKLKTPWVSGAIGRFNGYIISFTPADKESPCYRCFHPNPSVMPENASCADAGIIGAFTGIMGSMQAMEAIKIITGISKCSGYISRFNALTAEWKKSTIKRDKNCSCSQKFSA